MDKYIMLTKPSARFLASACLFIVASLADAQVIQPGARALSDLDDLVESYMEENNVPGGLIAVASRGRLVHLQSYGLANVELNVPVSETSVFEIGSISKQFVAAAALLLVEEGELDLDAGIHEYLADLPSEWLGVSMRQLLNHTSGIPDYEEIRSYDVYRFRLTPEEVIRIAHSRPMDFAPGTGWYYSNTGYFLASMIVERIDGRPLGQVLQARIFDPLGMTATRFADPEAIVPNRVAGYWVNKVGQLINRNPTETSSTLGAGGLMTTASDLAKWDRALYGDALLSAASKEVMWTSPVLPSGEDPEYALGWRVTPYQGMTSQSHGGQVAGFNAFFARYPEQEVAVIVFLNRYRVRTSNIAAAVLHTLMPSLGPIPDVNE
jgi:CubicO group peptidase (beta-lactamase class C family)